MTGQKDKTVDIILKTAKSLFLTKGFSGSSIGDIAKASKVGKSLIYHYFESKEHLWKAVKQSILNKYIELNKLEEIHKKNLKEFIVTLVKLRFDFYLDNPDIIKMIALQRLEKGTRVLSIKDSTLYNNIKNNIAKFKKQGHIKDKTDPDFATYFILSSTTNLFFDLDHDTIRARYHFYITQITNLILNALQNEEERK